MTSLLIEAVEKLIHSRPQYVRDAVIVISDQFQEMSDGGVDSLYAEPARRWRWLASDVETIANDPGANPGDEFDEDDLHLIAAGILWYELNTGS